MTTCPYRVSLLTLALHGSLPIMPLPMRVSVCCLIIRNVLTTLQSWAGLGWMTAPNKPLNRGCRAIPSADVTALKALAWTVSGFKSAAQEALSRAQTVLYPFHVVLWASNMPDDCRRLVQQETLGRRGHKSDPLYKLRRTPLTRIGYLFDTSRKQLSPCSLMCYTLR